jgi:hypothetical protein
MLAPMDRLWALAIGVALVAGCGGRGDQRFDQPCSKDEDCARGLCVAGVHGNDPVCTKSCARGEDCPEGWSCSGVTATNVLVCSHGSATPFGQ